MPWQDLASLTVDSRPLKRYSIWHSCSMPSTRFHHILHILHMHLLSNTEYPNIACSRSRLLTTLHVYMSSCLSIVLIIVLHCPPCPTPVVLSPHYFMLPKGYQSFPPVSSTFYYLSLLCRNKKSCQYCLQNDERGKNTCSLYEILSATDLATKHARSFAYAFRGSKL